MPDGRINVTDPDSRVMRTHGQPTIQGYNAQAAVTENQIIIAAEITIESPDFGHLEPVFDAALRNLERAGVSDRPAASRSSRARQTPRSCPSKHPLDVMRGAGLLAIRCVAQTQARQIPARSDPERVGGNGGMCPLTNERRREQRGRYLAIHFNRGANLRVRVICKSSEVEAVALVLVREIRVRAT
jgi:hypothetical protein